MEQPSPGSSPGTHKQPFDLESVLERVREAIQGHAAAAMFELAERGHTSLFEQLVACILSIRTRDEVSLPVALRLLSTARTPEAMRRLGTERLQALIRPVTFPEPKARTIHDIAVRAVEEFVGALPADVEVLQSFKGVGPKCAHLALGIAGGQTYISVDVHVHRVTNRWGYVHTRTPEQTLAALEAKLPRAHWVELNRLLVPFGKHVCTGVRPRCSTCPVLSMCQQVGVSTHR
ncbi:Endonuclease III [Cystobacter fuscus DSM 2262]|uniref:Endonuclease III n=1 Tax=Cystobacter fuscus (strain ATCC 25194 / DSM 2262 / NBRC 100088 / M29) TaxID=1242864 RepID=S9PCS1_CYSF2|nr:endonuclease III [Cystobacter fuscus]EPX60901.1 Endonuclease III [Cystobacter fuscus DSM 2262]